MPTRILPRAPSRPELAGAIGILTAVNASDNVKIPMPTTVIVDSERTIRWIDVHPDYTRRSEPEEILAALDRVASD